MTLVLRGCISRVFSSLVTTRALSFGIGPEISGQCDRSVTPLESIQTKAIVNTPPAKAGGFRLRLEAGYNRPFGSISQTTLKLSSGSSGFWSSMYFFQTSSVTFPLEATQYPLLHKCWPQ